MDDATHERVMDLAADALDRPHGEREAMLERACAGDSSLRRHVRDLLDVAAPARHAFERGQRDVALAALRGAMPARVGSYRLIAPIGQGGMGAVYLAEQQRTLRRVAVKLMRPGTLTPEALGRFEYEAELLGRLEHPGIARIYEAGVAPGDGGPQPYFAMEYVDGRRLDQFLRDANPSARARLELLVRICQAVHYAHARGVIHRDLKPANILITGDGSPKVLDFGVARAAGPREPGGVTSHTASGQLIGTLAYMSPEQASGRTRELDPGSDVYALGVIAFEMLAGRAPYETSNRAVHEAVRAICEQPPPRLGTLDRSLRGDVETIVGKALQKDKSRRYASAAEMADDVDRHLRHEPIAARPPGAAYQFAKFVRRNTVPVASLVGVILALAAGVCVSTVAMVRAERSRALAERRAADHAAVAEFVRDMVATADPYNLLGEHVTVLQATRAAADRLRAGQLDDQPLVKAAVLDTIGNTLSALGLYDDAEPPLRQSLALRRAALPAGDAEVATGVGNLATLLRRRGQLDEAEALAREALHIRRQRADASSDLATSLSNLGMVLHDQGRLADAEPLYREALRLFRRSLPADHPAIASTLNELAALLRDQGRLSEAEAMCREALALKRRALPADHPDVAHALNHLASLLLSAGKLAESEELFREALELHRAALPAAHTVVAKDLSNVATALMAQRRLAEAEPLYRKALEMLRAALPAGHADIAVALNNLASLLRDLGKTDEAETMFREALLIWRGSLPASHPNIATSLTNVAMLLQNRGDHTAATAMYREALDIIRAAHPAEHPQVARGLTHLGLALRKTGELRASESLLREALAITRATLPADHPDLAACLSNIASVLKDQDRLAEAEPLYREALRVCAANRDATATIVPRIAAHLHDLLTRAGRRDEAAALGQEYDLPVR